MAHTRWTDPGIHIWTWLSAHMVGKTKGKQVYSHAYDQTKESPQIFEESLNKVDGGTKNINLHFQTSAFFK